ncbi:N(5)-(carboxyethyl)ornithine synthase [Francisella adeliensis]|uniref:Alanine dehydrogenase n=1 Tax=Francisella adeliensis TaxID=2007306 RepID=A0A2Z4XWQ9_9GAMM|nr:N(5)-(carboxyethyl)ornithine synthase [Francisella adeliensis]AXA33130.1 alanine dehydrogenase [Francisella adeliensis]MBK2085978.1 alanine dehydrogenase [Francisella adeliensis]MBK2096858.1 alanine dehydrogenase [Francisella adeliensis]QIW11359.1 alanine dehydrogenase [Francisella adeliensis]QIW13234.1 alanine dehydrogenase [Francisella adeliensis]
MNKLTFGVIGTSRKENEQRLPIHPDHISEIPKEIREQLIFESGYGKSMNISDEKIASQTGGIASRDEILKSIGNIILAKPVLQDLMDIKDESIVWGWSHCVQQKEITQIAIDKKLTLLAFEDMYSLQDDKKTPRHSFWQNNELAGYCAVLHALQLKATDGRYGEQKKILIIGFGAVSRGAIYALQGRGFKDITVCSRRTIADLQDVINGCKYVRVSEDLSENKKLINLISKSDIIVNGILQDPNNPTIFINKKNFAKIKPNSLIIDVSCDEEMGFYFSKPTSFKKPMFKVESIDYYGVDHTPSYLWESTSRCISETVLSYLPNVILKKESGAKSKTLENSINIKNGMIQNSKIISFQNREDTYPYKYI